jgi:predicted GNAT family N-acyltransferase
MSISVHTVQTEQDLDAIHSVRNTVFVHEQDVPATIEIDEFDVNSYHAVARWEGKIIGTGRLVLENQYAGKIGRMAVLEAYRRLGVGGYVLEFLELYAWKMGFNEVALHAQVYVKGFYQKRGYKEEGSVFFEAGIQHILMRKKLA